MSKRHEPDTCDAPYGCPRSATPIDLQRRARPCGCSAHHPVCTPRPDDVLSSRVTNLMYLSRAKGGRTDLGSSLVHRRKRPWCTNAVEPGHLQWDICAGERYIKTRTLKFVTFTVDSDPPTPAPTRPGGGRAWPCLAVPGALAVPGRAWVAVPGGAWVYPDSLWGAQMS